MVSDPIADMLARIKNASLAGRQTLLIPHSKVKVAVAKILVEEGYLTEMEVVGIAPKLDIKVSIKYENNKPVLSSIKRKSKPGRRLYIGKSDIPLVLGGIGTAIISTPHGIMTGAEAKKRGVGGELLCEIW